MTRLVCSVLVVAVSAACGDNQAGEAADAGVDAPPDAETCSHVRLPDPDPAIEALLVKLEQRMAGERVAGIGIAVLDHGTTVHRATLGSREAGSCDRFTEDTRVRLGRPTRTLTAIAALAAIDEGVIALDAPVTSYLPGFQVSSGDASAVTVRRLLEYSAGVYVPDFMYSCPSQDPVAYWSSIDAMLEVAPGTALASYEEELALLGAVLSAAYEMPFRQVVAINVFEPLGMTATFDHDVFLAGDHGRGGTSLEDPAPCAVWEPVHQAYVSLRDLESLARFVSEGNTSVLSAESHSLLRDAGVPHFIAEYARGYGMDSLPYDADGARQYYSDGDIRGTGAEVNFFVDGFTTVFIENGGSCTYCFTDMIVEALSPHDFHEWLAPIETSRFSEYSGTWVDATSSPARTVTIAADSAGLSVTYNGQPLTLTTFGEDTFELSLFGSTDRLRFWRDSGGAPHILTSQFGRIGPAFHREP